MRYSPHYVYGYFFMASRLFCVFDQQITNNFKMSDFEYDSDIEDELDQVDEDFIEEMKQERCQDEDETDFHFWMSEENLHMPIEHWYNSKNSKITEKGTKLPIYRLQDLEQAAEHYVNIHGGSKRSVFVEMIKYFN